MNRGMEVFNTEGMTIHYSLEDALKVIERKLDEKAIKDHPAKKDSKGVPLKYISQSTVVRLLNEAFKYQWSFEIVAEEIVQSLPKYDKYSKKEIPQPPYVKVLGRLTVPGLGVREQYGSKILIGGASEQESAYKAACSDALKKCATLFGIGLELYEKDEEVAEHQEEVQTYKPYNQQAYYQVNQQNAYSQPKPQVQPSQAQAQVQQPQSQPNQWSQASVDKLKELMKNLGLMQQVQENGSLVEKPNKEGLAPYLREYFDNPSATFDWITPANIDAINKFLENKLKAQMQVPNLAVSEWV